VKITTIKELVKYIQTSQLSEAEEASIRGRYVTTIAWEQDNEVQPSN